MSGINTAAAEGIGSAATQTQHIIYAPWMHITVTIPLSIWSRSIWSNRFPGKHNHDASLQTCLDQVT